MVKNSEYDYGIKYSVMQLKDDIFILVPADIIPGYAINGQFEGDEILPLLSPSALNKHQFVVDSVCNSADLCARYELDDPEFVSEYLITEEQDYVILITNTSKGLTKKRISLKDLLAKIPTEIYDSFKETPTVSLNDDSLAMLLGIQDIHDLRKELLRLREHLKSCQKMTSEGVTRVYVERGKIKSIDVDPDAAVQPVINSATTSTNSQNSAFISLRGLEKYIKERVFGHDEEIRIIAKTLIMNYRARPEDGTEAILLIGPTGVGKTETVEAAAAYLNLPFVSVNTPNLVTQGIVGDNIEAYLGSLTAASNYDLAIAQKAFIFFDEFDKLGKSRLNIKAPVKDILLKFLEGYQFNVSSKKDKVLFSTRMLNKVYAGTFQDLFDSKSPIGFEQNRETGKFNIRSIYEAEYYGKELITRIPHIHIYNPLDRDTQRRVILEAKNSVLVKKITRYLRDFHVTLTPSPEYVEALLDALKAEDKSMRDLNNLILSSLNYVECALLENEGKISEITLTGETATNPHRFILK